MGCFEIKAKVEFLPTVHFSVRGDSLAHVGARLIIHGRMSVVVTVRVAILYSCVLSGRYLETFAATREGPLELDVGRVSGHAA